MNNNETKTLYNNYFKVESDKSVKFLGTKLIIQIPEEFIKRGITEINQTEINTLGIFEGYIFDNVDDDDISKPAHKFVLKFPAIINMIPSHIEKTSRQIEDVARDTLVKVNYYNFIFFKGDTYIKSTSVVQKFDTVDKFMYMLLNGQLPKSLRYDEVTSIWAKCAEINGSGSLKANFSILAMIVSNLIRDPKNYSNPFRLVYDSYYSRGVYNGKLIRYMDIPKYISNFTAITGADPRYGVTVAMDRVYGENKKDTLSPVEEIIK